MKNRKIGFIAFGLILLVSHKYAITAQAGKDKFQDILLHLIEFDENNRLKDNHDNLALFNYLQKSQNIDNEKVEGFLKNKANPQILLMQAIRMGSLELIELALRYGASVDKENILRESPIKLAEKLYAEQRIDKNKKNFEKIVGLLKPLEIKKQPLKKKTNKGTKKR